MRTRGRMLNDFVCMCIPTKATNVAQRNNVGMLPTNVDSCTMSVIPPCAMNFLGASGRCGEPPQKNSFPVAAQTKRNRLHCYRH